MKQSFFLIAMCICTLSRAHAAKDTTDHRFHDDLFDHLVGNWHVTGVAHELNFTSEVEVNWVLNHQFLLFHLRSNEVIPWWGVEMEYFEYIGYNHYKQRYTMHGMSIEGDEDISEGFGYGSRNGNDFRTSQKFGTDTAVVQHMIWQPETKTWRIQSRLEINNKEGDVFLEMKLTIK